jgi:hypothetical protein
VLTQAFYNAHLTAHPVRKGAHLAPPAAHGGVSDLEDERDVLQRLRDMGYLE